MILNLKKINQTRLNMIKIVKKLMNHNNNNIKTVTPRQKTKQQHIQTKCT